MLNCVLFHSDEGSELLCCLAVYLHNCRVGGVSFLFTDQVYVFAWRVEWQPLCFDIYWVHADFQTLCKCQNRKTSEADMIQIEFSSQSWAEEVHSMSYLHLVTLLAGDNIIWYLCLCKVDTSWDPQCMLTTLSCICTVFFLDLYAYNKV